MILILPAIARWRGGGGSVSEGLDGWDGTWSLVRELVVCGFYTVCFVSSVLVPASEQATLEVGEGGGGGGGEGAKSEVCNQDQKSGCLVALL